MFLHSSQDIAVCNILTMLDYLSARKTASHTDIFIIIYKRNDNYDRLTIC
jgi:hypothetical protein